MIRMKQVVVNSIKDNMEKPLLKQIDTTFQKGTLTLLAGQTGSGKSTFLQTLAGLIPLTSGSITYENCPLWSGSRINATINRRIGIAFQYPERQLFAESIRKELDYSLRPQRLSKAEKERAMHEALRQMSFRSNW